MSRYIDADRGRFGVEPICRTVDVSASAYYQRSKDERWARVVEDERLLEVIRVTHKQNYEAYGYRRLWKALRRKGETGPRCQVQRLMAEHGIGGAKRRGKPWRTTTSDPVALRRPDLVCRDFTARASNRLWVGDLTYLRCWRAAVLRVHTRRLQPNDRRLAARQPHARDLVLDALRMALGTREHGTDFALVAHTDAGS